MAWRIAGYQAGAAVMVAAVAAAAVTLAMEPRWATADSSWASEPKPGAVLPPSVPAAPALHPVLSGPTVGVNPFNVDIPVTHSLGDSAEGLTASIEPATHKLRWNPTLGRIQGTAAPRSEYRVLFSWKGSQLASSQFSTADAPRSTPTIELKDGAEYGVGMPIRVRFAHPVKDRAAVQRAAMVTSQPAQPGSWGWVSDTVMVWRPDAYWQPNTTVAVSLNLDKEPITAQHFGVSKQMSFRIGREVIMRIDSNTKHMQVFESGRNIRQLPVSLGKATPTHRTRSGVKIVFAKDDYYTMRGPANDPYTVNVRHAQRMTNTGEFLHGAPWSVGSQGRANVSHGCTNLSPGDAAWLFGVTKLGDVVETVNTGRPWDSIDNGWGGVWNVSPEKWRTYSAVKDATPGAAVPAQ